MPTTVTLTTPEPREHSIVNPTKYLNETQKFFEPGIIDFCGEPLPIQMIINFLNLHGMTPTPFNINNAIASIC